VLWIRKETKKGENNNEKGGKIGFCEILCYFERATGFAGDLSGRSKNKKKEAPIAAAFFKKTFPVFVCFNFQYFQFWS
jgi:hypothetical protein